MIKKLRRKISGPGGEPKLYFDYLKTFDRFLFLLVSLIFTSYFIFYAVTQFDVFSIVFLAMVAIAVHVDMYNYHNRDEFWENEEHYLVKRLNKIAKYEERMENR